MTTIDRARFQTGLTYDGFKDQMTRNRDRVEANEARIAFEPDDLEAFRALRSPMHVLALAEDWCGDVIANLPILGKLARESNGKLNVRVLLRDQDPGAKVMDEHLNKGQYKSIPTVIFLDSDFNEVGVWVERPESVTKLREA